MAQTCPLIFRQIDETLVRISAFLVSVFVVLFLYTSYLFLLYMIAIDFLIRLYGNKSYSPVHQLSKIIKKAFSLKTQMTDAGAKRLAAIFGLVFNVMMVAEYYLNLEIAIYVTAFIWLLCSYLEILFSYCVACQIYTIIKKVYPNFMEEF
jgi:hypothetical protein